MFEQTTKILIVIPSLHRGGAERVVSVLTTEWSQQHDVLVAVFDGADVAYPYGGNLVDLGIPAQTSVWRKVLNAARRIAQLADLIRREQPNHIVSFMESANFPAVLAAMWTGTLSRLTVSVRNNPNRFAAAHRLLIPAVYRFPNRVVAVSQGVANALERLGVAPEKLSVIPNPAPNTSPEDKNQDPPLLPPRYILGVGRLHPQKGFDRLIRAFAGIDDPNLHLVILGEGKERANLRALAKALGVASRVMMPGARDELDPWYRNALCFVLSSKYEGWPNVLMEAMSYGCPVVSFDCQFGPSEIIVHGVTGFIVADGDISGMRDTILTLVSNDNLRKSIGHESRLRMGYFGISRIASLWAS